MKDEQRDKLRDLPADQKLYLLQQNKHIKDHPFATSLKASNSNTSPHNLRSTIKRSDTRSLISCQSQPQPKSTLSSDSKEINERQQKVRRPPLHPSSTASASGSGSSNNESSSAKNDGSSGGRAESYRFNRWQQLTTNQNRSSKVGSMVLEFDALAQPDNEDASAWLLLDDKKSGPQTSSSRLPKVNGNGNSNSCNNNKNQYHSLTRKEGSHLGALAAVAANTAGADNDSTKRKDRNSPYFYVERLRSK